MAASTLVTKSGLPALLREAGFTGSSPNFRRAVGKTTMFVVNLQRSTGGGDYVNLGAHVKALGKTTWPDIKEYECAFRARLQDIAGGQRFFFDDAASVAALLEMMRIEGLPWFANFEPDRLAGTVKHVAKHGWDKLAPLGGSAGPDTWARVANSLKDTASEKRLLAQVEKLERARAAPREPAGPTVKMTMAEYRAAKKAGTLETGVTIQLVLD